ncbi:MAG: hypothetical protein ABI868_05090 [Acidobacteriota bacterium]
MSAFIVERLKSSPVSFRSGEEATLRLSLQAESAAGERTDVEYRLNPSNEVVFSENGGKVIKATFTVQSVPTSVDRKYALNSSRGKIVQITAVVLPERDEQSKETVTILS